MDTGYINIAIVKYWGKKEFNPYLIPYQGSISLRSTKLYTNTIIEKSEYDEFYLNGIKQDEKETDKIFSFVDKVIINRKEKIKIDSINYVPTAAGLASSASAYCALTKALNRYFNLNLKENEMAKISTMGSGSAGRSFYHLAAFDKCGNIYELETNLNLSMLVLVVSKEKKEISSRNAMNIAQLAPNFKKWVERANNDFEKMKIALKENDFKKIGNIMENNTIFMHNTTFRSTPSFSFLNKETYNIIKKIKRFRREYKLDMYFTMDAGPNVKLLYLKEDEEKILKIINNNFDCEIILC